MAVCCALLLVGGDSVETILSTDGAISHTRNIFSDTQRFCAHFSWTDIVFHDTLVSEL